MRVLLFILWEFYLREIFGVCKKPALNFLVQLEVSLSRLFFTVGTAFSKTCPTFAFHLPPPYPSWEPWENNKNQSGVYTW
jgi:hypothetical protein